MYKKTSRTLVTCSLITGAVLVASALTSCETEQPDINISFKEEIVINADLSDIVKALNDSNKSIADKLDLVVKAINDQTKSLSDKLSIIDETMKAGVADEKAASGLNTDAINSLQGSLENKLASIEAAMSNQNASL